MDPAERPLAESLEQAAARIKARGAAGPGLRSRRARSDDKEQAKVRAVGLIRQGKTLAEAAEAVGRSEKTIYGWKYESPKFAAQMEAAERALMLSQDREQMSWRERRDEIVQIRRDDYPSWATYVAAFRKQYFGFDTFAHQWRMLEAMEAAPGGGVTMILLPPAWTKTTTLCDSIAADLCMDPNFRTAIISGSLDFARRTMGRIARRFEGDGGAPSPLIEHYGPFKPDGVRSKKWNADEITLLASSHDEQDPSVVSVGIKGRVRGYRWDRVYLDDIQDIDSLGETAKFVTKYRQDVLTRPGKQGKIIIFGNRVGRGDFYEEMLRLELIDELVLIPALDLAKPVGSQSNFPRQWRRADGTTTPVKDEGVEPVIDEKGDQLGWDDDDLAKRREQVGEDQWSRVYMMEPESDYSAMVTPEDIARATDASRQPGAAEPNAVGSMSSLDPSLHAHAFFVDAAFDASRLYVLDCADVYKATTNQRLHAEIRRHTERFKPGWWVIENNTLQSGYLTDDAFLDLQAQFGFRAVGHHTGGEKKDEKLGIPAMMDAIVRGEIRFPRLVGEHEGFIRLFDQLMSWRPDKPAKVLVQDGVMALWFAYLLWRKLRAALDVEVNPIRRQGLANPTLYPWAKTNLVLPPAPRATEAAETYEQQWERLTRASA